MQSLGAEALAVPECDLDPHAYDVIHAFGLSLSALRDCRRSDALIVASPVYWGYRQVYGLDGSVGQLGTAWRRLKLAYGMGQRLFSDALASALKYTEYLREMALTFETVDLLLPNAAGEAEAVREELGVSTPMLVVPNGVDRSKFSFVDNPERSGVIYVGRVEPHKNQLGLLKAMKGSELPLTLIGWEHPHHGRYLKSCLRSAGQARILTSVDESQLVNELGKARVHVLPSWFETTGLASLEAAAAGCRIVTTDRGYAGEYFGEEAWYCDPSDKESIRQAVEEAHAMGTADRGLAERVSRQYSWKEVASATLHAYKTHLHDRGTRP